MPEHNATSDPIEAPPRESAPSSRSDPLAEDADAWAERERRRREAWLAGPDEAERRSWARRQRFEARSEFGPAAVGPTEDEVEEWADRERRRREAWLAGPSDDEKREWRRRQRRSRQRSTDPGPAYGYTADDLDHTARRIRRDVHLARAGALHLLATWPYTARAKLIESGHESESLLHEPSSPTRVPYYYDE